MIRLPAIKTRITNAKIACLDINLQRARMHLGVNIVIDDPNKLEDVRKRCGHGDLSPLKPADS